MAFTEEVNSTTTIISGGLFDSSRDDYFRLYDAGDEDDEASNFIVGIWNPFANQTNITSMSSVPDTFNIPHNNVSAWATTSNELFSSVSLLPSAAVPQPSSTLDFLSSSSSSAPILPTVNSSALNGHNSKSEEGHLFTTIAQTVVESAAGSSYGDEVDIALIDSAETVLDGDTDYGNVGFNGGGGVRIDASDTGANENFIRQSIAYSSGIGKNESLQQSFNEGSSVSRGDVGNVAGDKTGNSGSSFMLLLEDFGEYFYNFNGSTVSGITTVSSPNMTDFEYRMNCTNSTSSSAACYDITEVEHNYWALILILFPILTLFGNILVILSVCRERSLQTVTNYFIVSLAIADLLVAVVVMPFAVYVLDLDETVPSSSHFKNFGRMM
ncbi:dopamine D2-like receptor [Teleopsis dalmanni]|uniref:dopamine D2-like receptor n=1 Tax=Teleopsis dalmanni TaxID=139649 RepID=UPI0018CD9859|nr:dopamine D2-like receptor [Teleopsis dalmanni]